MVVESSHENGGFSNFFNLITTDQLKSSYEAGIKIPLVNLLLQVPAICPDLIWIKSKGFSFEKFGVFNLPLFISSPDDLRLSDLRAANVHLIFDNETEKKACLGNTELNTEQIYVGPNNSELLGWIISKTSTFKTKNQYYPYTLDGSLEKEIKINESILKIRLIAESVFHDNKEVSVLLVGGYGRGEGGLYKEGSSYYPSNNLDVLALYPRQNFLKLKPKLLKFQKLLRAFQEREGISVDCGYLSKERLQQGPLRLFYYDLAQGHKCLLGSNKFLQSNKFQDFKNIPLEEILNLVVNRVSLSLLNRWIMSTPRGSDYLKLMSRHAAKAIIACGDYFLFQINSFSWSYSKRQKLMREAMALPKELRDDYDAAVNFRFFPNYDTMSVKEIESLDARASAYAEKIFHDYCHSYSIQPKDFKRLILGRWTKKAFSIRNLLRAPGNFIRISKFKRFLSLPLLDKIMMSFLDNEERIWLLFARSAFAFPSEWGLEGWEIKSKDAISFYVESWLRWGDPNFYKLREEILL